MSCFILQFFENSLIGGSLNTFFNSQKFRQRDTLYQIPLQFIMQGCLKALFMKQFKCKIHPICIRKIKNVYTWAKLKITICDGEPGRWFGPEGILMFSHDLMICLAVLYSPKIFVTGHSLRKLRLIFSTLFLLMYCTNGPWFINTFQTTKEKLKVGLPTLVSMGTFLI